MLLAKSVIGALMGSAAAPPPPPPEPALSWAPPRMVSRALPWSPTPGEFTPVWPGSERDGTGVDVYVLDSGLDDTHPLFGGRATYLDTVSVEPPTGFKDGHGHGTACAGCVGADGVGLATGALIWGIKITTSATVLQYSTGAVTLGLEAALAHYQSRAATNRPAVISLSFGGGTMSAADVRNAIGACVGAGMVVVAAAGNDDTDITETIWPASHAGVLAVGGTDQWDFPYDAGGGLATNFGIHVPIYAPANLVTTLQTRYLFDPPGTRTFSGTSASAPLVAGMIACMLQGKSRLSGFGDVLGVIRKVVANATENLVRIPNSQDRPFLPQMAYLDPDISTESVELPAPPADFNAHHLQSTLAVNFTGADDSTSFTDLSPQGKTLTASGTARIVGNRLRLEGGSNHVTVTPVSGFHLMQASPASPSYTVEFEVVIHSLPPANRYILCYGPGDNTENWTVEIESNGRITFSFRSSFSTVRVFSIAPAGSITLGVPYRMAVSSDGFVTRAYVNGVQTHVDAFSARGSSMTNYASSAMTLGRATLSADCSIGYVRITPGVSRHANYLAEMPAALSGSGAAIQCVGYMTSAYAATGTTRAVTIPAAVQPGDLLVVGVMHRSAMSPPAGWTLVGTATDAGNNQFHSVFSKVAVGGDAGSNVTFTQAASGRMLASIVAARKSGGFTLRQVVSATLNNDRWSDFPVLDNGAGQVFAFACAGYWNNAGSMRPAIVPGFNLIAPRDATDTRTATAFVISPNGIHRRIYAWFNRSAISEISGVLAVWE